MYASCTGVHAEARSRDHLESFLSLNLLQFLRGTQNAAVENLKGMKLEIQTVIKMKFDTSQNVRTRFVM